MARRTNQTPEERKLQAQLAVHASWANTKDRLARTAPARNTFRASFEAQVDPNGELTPQERAYRADHAYKAHMKRMSLLAAKKRRLEAQARREANGGAAQ